VPVTPVTPVTPADKYKQIKWLMRYRCKVTAGNAGNANGKSTMKTGTEKLAAVTAAAEITENWRISSPHNAISLQKQTNIAPIRLSGARLASPFCIVAAPFRDWVPATSGRRSAMPPILSLGRRRKA
jgi:hypothetical protein